MAMVQLLVDGGIGLILIISGIIMNMISKRNNKQCTKSVEGYVISYSFTGESRMHPIVEYVVDGITYNTKKSIKASSLSKYQEYHYQLNLTLMKMKKATCISNQGLSQMSVRWQKNYGL